MLMPVVFQDKNGSNAIVVGKNLTHAGDQQVQMPILVHVGGFDPDGHFHVLRNRDFGEYARRRLSDPEDRIVPGIAANYVQQAVLIQVDRIDVADPRWAVYGVANSFELEEIRIHHHRLFYRSA